MTNPLRRVLLLSIASLSLYFSSLQVVPEIHSVDNEDAPSLPTTRSTAKEKPVLAINSTTTSPSSLQTPVKHTSARPLKDFILHIGPGKTGTTTLQCALMAMAFSNYDYWGKKTRLNLCGTYERHFVPKIDITKSTSDPQHPKTRAFWEHLDHLLRTATPKRSIIYSKEELSSPTRHYQLNDAFWNHLQTLLNARGYQLRIVVTYRRFADWLRSKDNHHGIALQNKGWKSGRNSLWTQLQEWMAHPSRLDSTATVLERLSNVSAPIQILNLHDPRGPVQAFVCDIVQNESRLCERNSLRTFPVKHQSIPTAYDLLSVEAYRRGWIRSDQSRTQVASLAHDFHRNQTDSVFPVTCPTREELMPLLQQTMEYEKAILPVFYESPMGKQALQDAFWKDVEQGKFCSVNVQQVLSNATWRQFFESL